MYAVLMLTHVILFVGLQKNKVIIYFSISCVFLSRNWQIKRNLHKKSQWFRNFYCSFSVSIPIQVKVEGPNIVIVGGGEGEGSAGQTKRGRWSWGMERREVGPQPNLGGGKHLPEHSFLGSPSHLTLPVARKEPFFLPDPDWAYQGSECSTLTSKTKFIEQWLLKYWPFSVTRIPTDISSHFTVSNKNVNSTNLLAEKNRKNPLRLANLLQHLRDHLSGSSVVGPCRAVPVPVSGSVSHGRSVRHHPGRLGRWLPWSAWEGNGDSVPETRMAGVHSHCRTIVHLDRC